MCCCIVTYMDNEAATEVKSIFKHVNNFCGGEKRAAPLRT